MKHYVTDTYLEIDIDLTTSRIANGIWSVVQQYAESLVVDLAFVIECQHMTELPENLLASVRFHHVRFLNRPNLSEDDNDDDVEEEEEEDAKVDDERSRLTPPRIRSRAGSSSGKYSPRSRSSSPTQETRFRVRPATPTGSIRSFESEDSNGRLFI